MFPLILSLAIYYKSCLFTYTCDSFEEGIIKLVIYPRYDKEELLKVVDESGTLLFNVRSTLFVVAPR